jgi:hypothetical protein
LTSFNMLLVLINCPTVPLPLFTFYKIWFRLVMAPAAWWCSASS